jgi:NADH-quinone oxidoreductase subunit J
MDASVYVNVILLTASVVLLFFAIEKKNLLHSAILLGLSSAIIGMSFFIAGAPVAAALEVLVCAGVITVLFISTISLTLGGEEQ